MVPQEVFFFKGSLRDNLKFGNQDATDGELWQALKQTQLLETIKNKERLRYYVIDQRCHFFP